MRILNAPQGSDEWLRDRMGVITASNFSRVFTTAGKKSTSQQGLVNELIAENLMDAPTETYKSKDMQRGNDLEPEARACAELLLNVDIEEVGLVKLDDHEIGCSPDGIWDNTALAIEIKCPKPGTHVSYMRRDKVPTTYVQQIQGQMLVLELSYMWFLSYCPGLPPVLLKVERDDKLLNAALPILIDTADEVKSETERLRKKYESR